MSPRLHGITAALPDTGWRDLRAAVFPDLPFIFIRLQTRRLGDMVTFDLRLTSGGSSGYIVIGNLLPLGFRPSDWYSEFAYLPCGTGDDNAKLSISPTGDVAYTQKVGRQGAAVISFPCFAAMPGPVRPPRHHDHPTQLRLKEHA